LAQAPSFASPQAPKSGAEGLRYIRGLNQSLLSISNQLQGVGQIT